MAIETEMALLKYRRTKIVATLGPSSDNDVTIEALIDAGVDVFRLNMSHGTHDSHRAAYERVRRIAAKRKRPTAVLVDLSGPKIRVGRFRDGKISLSLGQSVTVTTRDVAGDSKVIPSQYDGLARDVRRGDRILLDDGNLELEVQQVEGTDVDAVVRTGGVLKDHKGMNLPGVGLSAPSLTEKDREDAAFALELGADLMALSFVRHADDVRELRDLIKKLGGRAAIISKIERPEALENIERIVDASDGIMVARGDLGVELPPESVPLVQSQLIDLGRSRSKPVIVATQMLESMIEVPRPTRAEVSDVATAVHHGTDAVMLSAESASGNHPVEAVKMMDTIARQTEAYMWKQRAFGALTDDDDLRRPLAIPEALARSTAQLSRDLMARSILVISRSGRTSAILSSSRPAAPIIATSHDPQTCRTTSLLWGVVPVLTEPDELEEPHVLARQLASELGLGSVGQKVLIVRGLGDNPIHDLPSITVARL